MLHLPLCWNIFKLAIIPEYILKIPRIRLLKIPILCTLDKMFAYSDLRLGLTSQWKHFLKQSSCYLFTGGHLIISYVTLLQLSTVHIGVNKLLKVFLTGHFNWKRKCSIALIQNISTCFGFPNQLSAKIK